MLTRYVGAKDEEIGWSRELDVKTLDECAATHVVAAFDTRLDGMLFTGLVWELANFMDSLQRCLPREWQSFR
jgi:hypothetical protein